MPSLKHIHTYQRWKKRGAEFYWRCAHPDCTHIVAQSAVEGKRSLCNKCQVNTLILKWDDDTLRRAKPLCIECRNTKEARQYNKVKNVVQDLFKVHEEEEKEEVRSQ